MSKPIGGLTPEIIDAITGHINPTIRNELRNLLNGRPTNIPKGYENDFASSLRNIIKDIGAGSRNASAGDIAAGEVLGALSSGLVIGQAAHIISEIGGIIRNRQIANRANADMAAEIDRKLREDPNYLNRVRGIYVPPDLHDVELNEEKFGPTNRYFDPKTGRHFTSGGGNLNQPRNRNIGRDTSSSTSSSSSSSSGQQSNEGGLEAPIRNRLGRAAPIRNRIIQIDEDIEGEDDGEGYEEGKEGEKSITKRDPIPPLPPFIKDDPREAQRRNPEQPNDPNKPEQPLPPPQQPPPNVPRNPNIPNLPNTPYNQLMRNLQTRKIQPLERIIIDTRKTNNWVALVQQINANNNYQDNLFG